MAWILPATCQDRLLKVLPFSDLDIARTRIVLSLLAMLSLYIDPTTAGDLFHYLLRAGDPALSLRTLTGIFVGSPPI